MLAGGGTSFTLIDLLPLLSAFLGVPVILYVIGRATRDMRSNVGPALGESVCRVREGREGDQSVVSR